MMTSVTVSTLISHDHQSLLFGTHVLYQRVGLMLYLITGPHTSIAMLHPSSSFKTLVYVKK